MQTTERDEHLLEEENNSSEDSKEDSLFQPSVSNATKNTASVIITAKLKHSNMNINRELKAKV